MVGSCKNGLAGLFLLLCCVTCTTAAARSRPVALPEVLVESTPLLMHVGEKIPPLLFSIKGYRGHESYTTAIQGSPKLTVVADRISSPGVYPIHIAAANDALGSVPPQLS